MIATEEMIDFFEMKIDAEPENEDIYEVAIKALEREPLTDTEQRIFLAAMVREQKVCKEVCKDGDGVDLVAVCRSIERKVKKALWG